MKPFELRNLESFLQLDYAQLLATPMFPAYYPQGAQELIHKWDEFMDDASCIANRELFASTHGDQPQAAANAKVVELSYDPTIQEHLD